MEINADDTVFLARPPANVDELKEATGSYASHEVSRYYGDWPFAKSEQELEKKFKEYGESDEYVFWLLEDVERKKLIGLMQLHFIDYLHSVGFSALFIGDRQYWHKGYGYRFALARTLYAASVLDLFILRSYIVSPNVASARILEKLGYYRYGVVPAAAKVDGKYVAEYRYVWYNPRRVDVVFEGNVPDFLRQPLERAKRALEEAERITTFI